jgi:hypothetical protein
MSKRNKRSEHKKSQGVPHKEHENKSKPKGRSGMDVAIYSLGIVGAIALGLCGMLYGSHKSPSVWIFFVGVVALVCGACLFWQQQIWKSDAILGSDKPKEEPPKIVYFGGLTPGTDPDIPLPAGVSADTVQLLLGDDLRILSASSSAVFSKDGKAFLSIEDRDGRILLTATLLDKSNRYICRVIENEFQISPERAFNPKQPDAHSLIVRDADGVEVLNLKFLNPKTMRITGRFQLPGSSEPVLILPKEGLVWPGGRGGIGGLTLNMLSKGGLIAF